MQPASFRRFSRYNWVAVWALIRVEARAFWDTRFMLFSEIIMPFMYFLFIALPLANTVGSISFQGQLISYPDYVLVGLLAMNMMQQMVRVIYRMAVDRQYGFYALKMIGGVSPGIYIGIMSISSIMGYAVQGIVFYLLILLFHLHVSLGNFILLWAIGLIAFFFWAGLAAMVTMKIDSFTTRDAVVSFVVTPLSFSAPAFYVWKEAPAFIRYIAICNPLTYQLEVLREVAFDTLSIPSFLLVCMFSMISIALATWVVSHAALIAGKGE